MSNTLICDCPEIGDGGQTRLPSHLTVVLVFALLFLPTLASAQAPARFYWKSLMGGNGVPLIYMSMGGNSNPLDPANVVSTDVEFQAEILVAGYAKMFPLFGRSSMLAVLATTGRISADTTVAGRSVSDHTNGFGDPLVEWVVNLVGPPPIMNIPDMLRYQPGFSLDLLVDLTLPIGEYDKDESLNIGQNRWYGRVGAPIVWQLGPWVPGRRTTLEFLPSVWIYGDNDDFGGTTLETDPMVEVEGHLTRDFTSELWGSLDGVWLTGGESTIDDGDKGESAESLAIGYTLGYQLSEKLQLTIGYVSTISDSAPEDLRGDLIKISLVYGWHKLIEGVERLQGDG